VRKTNNQLHRSKDYQIGKGRPPVERRWKPGQSGNPRGRPRGAKNLATFLAEALNEKIRIQERGRIRPITAREAIVKKIVHEALKGNLKAASFLFGYEPEISQKAQIAQDRKIDWDSLSPKEQEARAYETYFRRIRQVRG